MNELARSLSRFIDVVFALLFFRIVESLPCLRRTLEAAAAWLLSLLVSQPTNLTRVVFGLLIVVYYWTRKNTLHSFIEQANIALAVLSIASLSFVCLFMYALVADPTYVGGCSCNHVVSRLQAF
ncbi:MAG: hypothetical protein WBP75_13660 [Candidatus Cybelea sp.]